MQCDKKMIVWHGLQYWRRRQCGEVHSIDVVGYIVCHLAQVKRGRGVTVVMTTQPSITNRCEL